ncbi:monofunctional biosynthetic peptidoglycan transglycosylase [bacterium]|nr:monofunctional biosynthetic peptidoglycan transglycosylase [bacterium]
MKFKNIFRKRRLWRYIITVFGTIIFVSFALVLPWRWFAPPTTSFIIQGQLHYKSPIHQRWVPLSKISRTIPIAVVAAEDQMFPIHHGFDFKSISKSFEENRRYRRGASTISQQLAKNLYLWPSRSPIRKALEVYFTVMIEFTWPKHRILEVYLNVVEFGPRVYGVDAASRLFFGKPPSRITSEEAALLAAVLPNPKRMSVVHPSQYVLRRASEIEVAVNSLGGPGYLYRM